MDANEVPVLTRQDARGLPTLHQQYLRSSSTAQSTPIAYSAVAFRYDGLGRLVSTTDEAGNATLNTYDALSRPRSSTDPDLGLTTYEYDLRSQLTDRIIASGEKTHHEYDAIGRLTQTDYLRPRSIPNGGSGSGPTLNPGDPVGVAPDPNQFCSSIDFSEPTRFVATPPGPPRPTALGALRLTSRDPTWAAHTSPSSDFKI